MNEPSDLKIRLFLAAVTIVGMIVLAGTYRGNMVSGAASGPMPRVTAITQVTHDGFRKTNLLADDSQLYVTELPASNRVIAKVTLPGSERLVMPSPFANLQALDLSADHSKLLISSTSKSGDSEFWTLPVSAGTPQRVGDLDGPRCELVGGRKTTGVRQGLDSLCCECGRKRGTPGVRRGGIGFCSALFAGWTIHTVHGQRHGLEYDFDVGSWT